jgi:DNA-binding NtrC family response regulator
MPDDYEDIETDAGRDALADDVPPALVAMISVDGVMSIRHLPASGLVTIGRDPTCDVVVSHPSVSRQHARLAVAPLAIEDLGSRNGTRLRGAELAARVPAALTVGEAIQIGEAAILIHTAGVLLDEPRGAPEQSAQSFARALETECARSARSRSPFAYVRVVVDGGPADAGDSLREIMRTADLVANDSSSSSFQVLLVDTPPEQAERAIARMRHLLARKSINVRVGAARYPLDGVAAEQLVAHAWRELERDSAAASTAMDQVRALIAQVATGQLSVLITGETGVGKELCAEMIHRLSPRAAKPFVKLNCAAIVESLIESELFGHERGAFTGAIAARAGLFEAGNGGTVFLDEIGELPLTIQSKLLRVLEDREVRRVGASVGKTLDIRFVCATNRVLADEVAAGRFRCDLYYRVNGVTLAMAPLRERRDEIMGLARAFAARARGGIPAPPFAADVVAALQAHAWPGNIRELRNTIERAVLLSSGGEVRIAHLALPAHARSETITSRTAPTTPPDASAKFVAESAGLALAVADLEKQRILAALREHAGNQTRAARVLGMSRNTLVARLDMYGVPRPRKPGT